MTNDPRKTVEEALIRKGFENVSVDKILNVLKINAIYKGRHVRIKLTDEDLDSSPKHLREIFKRSLET